MTRSLRLPVTLLVLLLVPAAEAKPIYITVPRAYGSHEPVVVDVAFSGRDPVELRILKPENPASFFSGQANLRRARNQRG